MNEKDKKKNRFFEVSFRVGVGSFGGPVNYII